MPSLRTFTGEFPCVDTALLPDNAAQETLDCNFSSGGVTGIRRRKAITVPLQANPAKAMYVHADHGFASRLFAWPYDVDAVRGPIANDTYKRFYWTDGVAEMYVSRGNLGNGSDPKASGNAYKVGVPEPVSAPVCTTSNSTFTIVGVPMVNFFKACETPGGELQGKTSVPATIISQSRNDLVMTLNMSGLACLTGNAPANAVIAWGTVKIPLADWVVMSGLSGYSDLNSVYATIYRTVSGATPRYYCYVESNMLSGFYPYNAAYTVPWTLPDTGATVTLRYLAATRTARGAWFCSDASASAPVIDPSFAGIPGASALPVIPITANLAGGGTASGVLRPGGNSTLPPELANYNIEITLEGTTARLRWSYAGADLFSRDYVYTYVNTYGEEGPPSPVLTMDGRDGEALTFVAATPPTGYVPISKVRLYRTATGASGNTQYLFVLEANVGAALSDNVLTERLGEPLSTLGYRPPELGLRGLIALPNGVLAAFKGNEVHLSEPYLPYAWKSANIQTTLLPVTGLCAAEGGFYITTRGQPYFVSGITPDAMSAQKLQVAQAGVSKGSIVNVGAQVVYASNDGLVLLQGAQASLDASFKFFTRQEWRDRYGSKLSQMRLNAHDGQLVCWFEDGTPGFLLRLDETAASFTRLSEPIYAAVVHPDADALYVAVGNTAHEFKGDSTTHPFVWHSKDFVVTKPLNYGALQLVGSGAVTVKVYADGDLKITTTETVASNGDTVLRLPSGFLARKWSVRLEGATGAEIHELNLVGSMSELKNV